MKNPVLESQILCLKSEQKVLEDEVGRLRADLREANARADIWEKNYTQSETKTMRALRLRAEKAELLVKQVRRIHGQAMVRVCGRAEKAEARADAAEKELAEAMNEAHVIGANLSQQLRDAEARLSEARDECAQAIFDRDEAQKQTATLRVQLSEEYRDWMKEQCNEECRYGERLYADKYDEAKRLRAALAPIVNLMVSMQSLGYFTNDEWQSRLMAAQAALGAKQ